MKIAPAAAEQFFRQFRGQPPEKWRAVLVFGPDAGLASARARALLACGGEDWMRHHADLTREKPAAAVSRISQPSLGASGQILRLTGPAEKLWQALKDILALPHSEGLAVLEAGDLRPASGLRRLAERAANVAAIGCYPDTPAMLIQLVRARLKEAKLAIEPDALAAISARLGADRGISESEIAKLILYKGSKGVVTLDDIDASVSGSRTSALEDTASAAAGGETQMLMRHNRNAREQGLAPAALLESALRYFRRLHLIAAIGGDSPEEVFARLRPPVHFSRRAALAKACRQWPERRARTAFARLWAGAVQLRRSGLPAIASASLLTLARAAAIGGNQNGRRARQADRRSGRQN